MFSNFQSWLFENIRSKRKRETDLFNSGFGLNQWGKEQKVVFQ